MCTSNSHLAEKPREIRDEALGPLEVTPEGLEAAAKFAVESGMVPWNSPHWEVLEFLQDILLRIRRVPANPDETQ
jgi:hypothetical protein